jgi:hypothetical protein
MDITAASFSRKARAGRVHLPEVNLLDLRALLADADCPFGRDAGDFVAAIKDGREPRRTSLIRLSELAGFAEQRYGEPVPLAALDRQMVDEIGARHVDVVNLGDLHRRTLRRLTRRPAPLENITLDVPASARGAA